MLLVLGKKIFAWGRSGAPLGLQDALTDHPEPADISAHFDDNKFVEISAGSQHCMVLTANGSLYSWGQNHSGQVRSPRPSPFGSPFFQISDSCGVNLAFPNCAFSACTRRHARSNNA